MVFGQKPQSEQQLEVIGVDGGRPEIEFTCHGFDLGVALGIDIQGAVFCPVEAQHLVIAPVRILEFAGVLFGTICDVDPQFKAVGGHVFKAQGVEGTVERKFQFADGKGQESGGGTAG